MELKSSLCSSQTAPSSPAAAPRSAPPLAPRMENIPAGILPGSSVSSGNFGGGDQNRALSAAAAPGGAGEVRLDCGAEPWHPQGGIWQLCSLSFHLPCLSRLLLQLQRQMVKKKPKCLEKGGGWDWIFGCFAGMEIILQVIIFWSRESKDGKGIVVIPLESRYSFEIPRGCFGDSKERFPCWWMI